MHRLAAAVAACAAPILLWLFGYLNNHTGFIGAVSMLALAMIFTTVTSYWKGAVSIFDDQVDQIEKLNAFDVELQERLREKVHDVSGCALALLKLVLSYGEIEYGPLKHQSEIDENEFDIALKELQAIHLIKTREERIETRTVKVFLSVPEGYTSCLKKVLYL
jgi:hypothetical protein